MKEMQLLSMLNMLMCMGVLFVIFTRWTRWTRGGIGVRGVMSIGWDYAEIGLNLGLILTNFILWQQTGEGWNLLMCWLWVICGFLNGFTFYLRHMRDNPDSDDE